MKNNNDKKVVVIFGVWSLPYISQVYHPYAQIEPAQCTSKQHVHKEENGLHPNIPKFKKLFFSELQMQESTTRK